MTTLEERVDRLELFHEETLQMMRGIVIHLQSLDTRMQRLEAELQQLSARVDRMESSFEVMEELVSDIHQHLKINRED